MKCDVCGAELVEVDRWVMTIEDIEAQKRRALDDPDATLTDGERERFEQVVGDGSAWRQLSCPRDQTHTGFLAERIG